MEFVRRDKYSSVSAEGYTVSAASVNGQWVFTAWPPKSTDKYAPHPSALNYSQCVNDCYTACHNHYHQQPKAA